MCVNSKAHCFKFTVSLWERKGDRQGRLKVLKNPFLAAVTQTCGWCCCSGRRGCCCWRSCWRWGVDAGCRALSSGASLAFLVRPEQHVEGAPVYRNVWSVVLAEPAMHSFFLSFKDMKKLPTLRIFWDLAFGFPPLSKHDKSIFSIFTGFYSQHLNRDMWEEFYPILRGFIPKALEQSKDIITHFSFPIFMKSLPLLQLEFLAVRVNAEQEKFSLHLLFFPRWDIQ